MADTISVGTFKPIEFKEFFSEEGRKLDTSDKWYKDAFNDIIGAIAKGEAELSQTQDCIWIHGAGIWLRITKQGVIEFGEPAA